MNRETLKILLVDDNDVENILIKKLLQGNWQCYNYIIQSAKSLSDAIKALNEQTFSLVLLDVMLADSEGVETVQSINHIHPDIPIIVLTSDDDEQAALLMIQNGASDCLLKESLTANHLHRSIAYSIERKKSQTSLRKNNSVVNSIFNAAPVGIAFVRNRFIYRMNNRILEMCGYCEKDFLGKTLLMMYQNIAEYNRVGYELYEKHNCVETKWRRKEGGLIDVLIYAAPLTANDPESGNIITVCDITKMKRSQEEILKRHKETQRYFDASGLMILVLDKDIKVQEINNKGCEILGYDENEIINKDWCSMFVPQKFRQRAIDVLTGIIEGKIEINEYIENPILTKAGESRLIAWHNVALYDEARHIIKIVSIGEDITDRKKVEDELKQAYKELQQKNMELQVRLDQITQDRQVVA